MSRATNRTSNISVTWNFKNPNISRNELINYIHLFREVPGYSRELSRLREAPCYSRGLSRHYLAISAVSRFSTASRSSSGAISPFSSFIGRTPESLLKGFPFRVCVLPKVSRLLHLKSRDSCCLSILYGLAVLVRHHISIFIFHRMPARKCPERLSFPSQRPLESFPTLPPEISRFSTASRSSSGSISPLSSFISHRTPARKFPERLFSPSQRPLESFPTTPPEISRFLLPLDSLRPRGLRQTPYLHFHQSPARKSPERLFSPIQHPPESFPTTPPEISRFPFGTKVIKILDLSLYLPPTRPFAVSPTLSYFPKPVLHQPRHQTESVPLVHQSPCTFYPHLTLSYNTHQSSSSLPIITKFAFPTGSSALLSFLFPKTSPSPTTPPDRIHSSRSSISLHDLSSSHPVLQQHSSVQFITSDNYQVRFPDSSPCTVLLQSGNLELVAQGIARNLKRSAPM